ncbi:MAG TPA: phosphatidylserine/phosphatidylglycerophosphate/cardiolipin synthase family protein [Clostridia bacterium]|nr:phosphatidylserine/phosphatidylglycerophosphate/cardiolipin synthase family protein [Clostridia bacterium]
MAKRPAALLFKAVLLLLLLSFTGLTGCKTIGARKQQSLDEWRNLTAPAAALPRAFVKRDNVRLYFPTPTGIEAFTADWTPLRAPTGVYRVNTALLHWDRRLNEVPKHDSGWREAIVIGRSEWRQLATSLMSELAPKEPGHGVYYQAFLEDRLLYRDAQGAVRSAPLGEEPRDVVIEHRYSMNESLDILARRISNHLARSHPQGSLFLVMAPNAKRFTQPLLLDRQHRRCVFLSPAALYDTTDRGATLSATAQGLIALLPESHGLALLKNPVSSAARLGDFGAATAYRFLRPPLPRVRKSVPLKHAQGMDLYAWEKWLDRYTGTRREEGSASLLIDGDRFFRRLHEAFDQATNSIHVNMYIFDRDDIAIKVADQLKARSEEVDVKVILDRMGSVGAGFAPPSTPLPEGFVPPPSIPRYLRQDSQVQVRKFLNPWFSSDHVKVILVDQTYAWLGGMNFGREYRYEWHDLMVEVQGPVVASLEKEFRREWAHAGPWGDLGYLAALLSESKTNSTPSSSSLQGTVRLLPTKTAWKPFAKAIMKSLRRAQNHIYVENPYLFDKRVVRALVRARQRGIDVRVILPGINDFKAGGRSNLVIANYLLGHGVRVYFYPGMSHVKALMVDGWACVGSGNLNHLSLRLNHEQNLASSDPEFAAQLRRNLFESDMARSYELTEPLSVDWVDFLADVIIESF